MEGLRGLCCGTGRPAVGTALRGGIWGGVGPRVVTYGLGIIGPGVRPHNCRYSLASPRRDAGRGSRGRNSRWDWFLEKGRDFVANLCSGGVSGTDSSYHLQEHPGWGDRAGSPAREGLHLRWNPWGCWCLSHISPTPAAPVLSARTPQPAEVTGAELDTVWSLSTARQWICSSTR